MAAWSSPLGSQFGYLRSFSSRPPDLHHYLGLYLQQRTSALAAGIPIACGVSYKCGVYPQNVSRNWPRKWFRFRGAGPSCPSRKINFPQICPPQEDSYAPLALNRHRAKRFLLKRVGMIRSGSFNHDEPPAVSSESAGPTSTTKGGLGPATISSWRKGVG